MKEKIVDKLNKLRDKVRELIEKVNIFKNIFTKIEGGLRIKLTSNMSTTLFYQALNIEIKKWCINICEKGEDQGTILRLGVDECSDKSASWLVVEFLGFGFEVTKIYEIEVKKPKKTTKKKATTKRLKRKTGVKKHW